jgi:hypothetical protein
MQRRRALIATGIAARAMRRNRRVVAGSGLCLGLRRSLLDLQRAGLSSSSRAFARKASSPPRWSTVRSAEAAMRKRKLRPSASDCSVTCVQVRQVAPAGLDVGVADPVAGQHALAGQFTTAGHGYTSEWLASAQLWRESTPLTGASTGRQAHAARRGAFVQRRRACSTRDLRWSTIGGFVTVEEELKSTQRL